MFGAFKKLFSKPDAPEQPSVQPAKPEPQKPGAAPAPKPPAATPVAAAPALAKPHEVSAAPAAMPAAPGAPMVVVPANLAGADGTIQLPLSHIVAGLPPNLAALAVGAVGEFPLPVKTALAQLPTGMVKISFGQLRRESPPGSFAENPSQDQALVNLPLGQIIASIDPAVLTRRPGQRMAVVPESVTSVFGKHMPFNSNAAVTSKLAAAPEPAPPEPKPEPPAPATAHPAASAPAHMATPAPKLTMPPPGASPFTRPPAAPTVSSSLPKPPAPGPLPASPVKPPGGSPLPSQFSRPPGSAPLPSSLPKPPGAAPLPSAPKAPASMPFTAPKAPVFSSSAATAPPAPQTVRPSPAQPVGQVPETEFLPVPLSSISESWPAPVLQEVDQLNLRGATISLPMARLDAAMKTGRVVFPWAELSRWIQPAPARVSQAAGETVLELPLKVIAPLFLAGRRPAAAQKKLAVAGNIPDLFAGAAKPPSPAATAPPTPAAPGPQPPAPASALGEILGEPAKTEWSPQDINRKICALAGVAGSVLATSDGLLVAGQVPASMKTETVAAFLPQIFGRVTQYAGEMQLGPVTGVLITAGEGPCAIYKTEKLYLAVLGRPGEALPEAALDRIAAELAKRNI